LKIDLKFGSKTNGVTRYPAPRGKNILRPHQQKLQSLKQKISTKARKK